MKRVYGWKRSPEDLRDKVADPAGLAILPEVDLRQSPAMPVVYDQGQLGSCTANAVAAALQFDCSLDRRLQGRGNCHRRARLDIYNGERMLEGDPADQDTGAYGRDGFKYAQQTGVLLESVWPYDISTFAGPPPSGRRHLLTKPYAAVTQDVDHIKAVLSNQQTVAIGFDVYSAFEDTTGTTGYLDKPRRGESHLGGHEVLIVGYLASEPDYALVRNSWGAGWGPLGGYFLMEWDYVTDPYLCGDLRTIVRAAA